MYELSALGFRPFFEEQLRSTADDGRIPARIAAEHRGAYEVWSATGPGRAQLAGRLRLALEATGAGAPAVGDWVAVENAPGPDQATVIERVLERRTVFTRGAAGREARAQVVAAKVDLVFVLARRRPGILGMAGSSRLASFTRAACGLSCLVVMVHAAHSAPLGSGRRQGDAMMGEGWTLRWPRAIALGCFGCMGLALAACGGKSQPTATGSTTSTASAEGPSGWQPGDDNKEGCPCGCDHSVAMAEELREQGGAPALAHIDRTLLIIAEREDEGYITEAQIEHRLRMLALERELGANVGTAAPNRPAMRAIESESAREALPAAEDASLRVRSDLYVHGQTTEIVDGREKELRAAYRLWLQIENRTDRALTVESPAIASSVPFPVSRWYLAGTAGEPWDGVLGPGETKTVHVIGYLGEPVLPGTELDASFRVGTLTVDTHARARRRWNRAG